MSANISTQNLLLGPGSKFLSVMIPSRSRFDKLLDCLRTFQSQLGPSSSEVEFIVNLDSDDTLSRMKELPFASLDIKVIVSSKLGGYKDLFVFYNECARVARGQLLLMWNDDAHFKTAQWYSMLKSQVMQDTSAYSYWFGGTPCRLSPRVNLRRFKTGPALSRIIGCFISSLDSMAIKAEWTHFCTMCLGRWDF